MKSLNSPHDESDPLQIGCEVLSIDGPSSGVVLPIPIQGEGGRCAVLKRRLREILSCPLGNKPSQVTDTPNRVKPLAELTLLQPKYARDAKWINKWEVDQYEIDQTKKFWNDSKPKHAVEGLGSGLKTMAWGVSGAVGGIIAAPILGAKEGCTTEISTNQF